MLSPLQIRLQQEMVESAGSSGLVVFERNYSGLHWLEWLCHLYDDNDHKIISLQFIALYINEYLLGGPNVSTDPRSSGSCI